MMPILFSWVFLMFFFLSFAVRKKDFHLMKFRRYEIQWPPGTLHLLVAADISWHQSVAAAAARGRISLLVWFQFFRRGRSSVAEWSPVSDSNDSTSSTWWRWVEQTPGDCSANLFVSNVARCTVWVKKIPPWGFLKFPPKRLRIFTPNFTCLLYVPIYARRHIFVQLSATLTKLCHIKCDQSTTQRAFRPMVDILRIWCELGGRV